MTPTENDIAILLSAGEGQRLEFKRSLSSSVAREMVAFANAEGGRIIFGVDDKNHVVGIEDINRETSSILSTARNCDPPILATVHHVKVGDNSLLVADISVGNKKPYSCHDGYFLRIGATSQKMNRDELVAFVRKNAPISFDDMICPSFTQKDFDEPAYQSFLNKAHINAAEMDSWDVLRNLNLVSVAGDDEQPVYKNTAVLFFGKEPSRFIRQSVVTCVLFAGTDKADVLDRKDMEGNLAENVRQAMSFLKRHLSLRYEIKTLVRKEILELPEQALREALLNAVSHRDYTQTGAVVMVEIYRDRVEIVSPGGLPCGLKQSELGKRSIHRNPLIADMFHRLGEVEKIGSGIPRILKEAREAKVPVPQFHANGFFSVVFPKPKNIPKNKIKKSAPSRHQVGTKFIPTSEQLVILRLCRLEKSLLALMTSVGRTDRTKFRHALLKPLLDKELLSMTAPDNPNSSRQRYVLTKKGQIFLNRVQKLIK